MPASLELITPTENEQAEAQAGSRFLSQTLQKHEPVRLRAGTAEDAEEVILSGNLALLMQNVLDAVAQGQTVTVLPAQTEMTTNEAADILGVSRPHLVKLLNGGHIAFRQVGTKRRIPVRDVLRYREETKAKRLQTLQALQDDAQALDMGY